MKHDGEGEANSSLSTTEGPNWSSQLIITKAEFSIVSTGMKDLTFLPMFTCGPMLQYKVELNCCHMLNM